MTKPKRNRDLLRGLTRSVPWRALVGLDPARAPEGRQGRLPFVSEEMLRIHFKSVRFTLSVPPVEEALHQVPLFC